MIGTISEPVLHVFIFAPLETHTTAREHALGRAWSAASKLGLTKAVPGFHHPVELPAEMPREDVYFRVVASKADASGLHRAVAFTAHDVAAVALRLSAEPGLGWADLGDTWRQAAGDREWTGAFAVVQVFTGATAEFAELLAEATADHVRNILTRNTDAGPEHSIVVDPGIALWEMDKPWGRSVVALATAGAATTINEWCWLSGANDDIGAFARYLMHASKLRLETGVFRNGISQLHKLESNLKARLDELFALHERFETSGAAADELIQAQSKLSRAQGDAAGLVNSITHLRDLRRTVQIATDNMQAHAPQPMTGLSSGTSPFGRDFELSKWVDRRIGDELAYLESVRERASEAQALTDLRLKQITAGHARTANWLMVLQTSLVGALIGALGVATALGDPFPVPQSLRAAVMVLVAMMAVTLPTLAMRWPHGYRWPELTAAAAVGAAAGWAAAEYAGYAGWFSTTTTRNLASALLGAALFASAASLVNILWSPRRPQVSNLGRRTER